MRLRIKLKLKKTQVSFKLATIDISTTDGNLKIDSMNKKIDDLIMNLDAKHEVADTVAKLKGDVDF